MDRIKLTPALANHYQQDDLPAWMFKQNYDSAVNIISNPEKFHKANIAKVEWLVDQMFQCDPIACHSGI